ncbi:hypothetical protein Q9295_07665 [Xinfangfangia sp. CPCC 101601]|uniref:SGNH/GDSL hydrolase family protein n=1 Tax=Pseudogemmobacter lacusdianii TaxID=3069608 RepID=A0ABU0VWV8_9RHOB|nr:hypothetical protein [Xinfangfangia sp. CPCC 101601]MDQ2066245.1 hypothetical protein [Xinfangfangia sp. CPCC 101601]
MGLFGLAAKILFVGHSLVGPDLPGMVEAGLAHMATPAQVQSQIIDGAPLSYAWEHSAAAVGVDARERLATGDVTDLVLTEGIPLLAQMRWNDSEELVARWAEAAVEVNPDTRVWLYETWHSLNSGLGVEVPHDDGADVAWRQRLRDDLPRWQEVAGPHAQLIPAGQAMGLLADEIAAGQVPGVADIRALFSDDIHPNGKGFYFITMVHLAAVTGKSPEGLPAKLSRTWANRDAVITDAQAAAFQRIAWQAVSQYQAEYGAADAPVWSKAEAAKVAAAPLPAFDPITNPNLGLGLAGVHDWSVQQPFLNVMKTARPWVGHLPGRWGGMEDADLRAAGHLDADGWPKDIPEGVTALATLILTDLPAEAGGVAGRYILRHSGKGALKVEGRARVVREAVGEVVFDYTPGEGAVILTLTETDPVDPLRDIVVVRQDRAEALAAGQIFNPDWLARIKGVRLLRFMDWMATNDSTLARAEDRPKPQDFTWARAGVPVEIMVALANELQAEPWLTLPHLADDGLVQAYAAVVRAELDPGLRVWVELSNEVWNWQFAQAHWAEAEGKARWGRDGTWLQFYGLRAAQVMAVFADAMGGTERMVRVVATQTGVEGVEDAILTAPLAQAEGLAAPAESFDLWAVTGYFSGLLGAEHRVPMVKAWIAESAAVTEVAALDKGLRGRELTAYRAAHRYDLAIERAVAELRDGSRSGAGEDTLAQLLTQTLPRQAKVAAAHGLKLGMYEGGTHVVGYGAAVDDRALEEFFVALNYSAGMGQLYRELLTGWAEVSDQPFNAFVDVYGPNKWGSWGALRHLGDDNPRWAALARGCEC